ncbi:MAG TPA: Calx-beta domain-containing protein [Dongiaceae bacterium]|nr:Calx-beta domain-containing protein [Dongiaceae bacterium]
MLPNDISVSIFTTAGMVGIGTKYGYTVTVTNTGPTAATDVILTNVLPANVTLVSASLSAGVWTNMDGTLVCNLGTVAGQTGVTLDLTVQTTAVGYLTDAATVTRAEPDAELPNNYAVITSVASAPALYVGNASVNEGNTGATTLAVPVHLLPTSQQTVTVNYITVAGTATASTDYFSTNGALTFAPGESEKTVNVAVVGDIIRETNEVFYLKLSQANNADIANGTGTATILDDDQLPRIAVFDAVVTEGNVGYTNATFTAMLTAPSGVPVNLYYQTYADTASSPGDYLSTNGIVTFPPGTLSQTFTVPVRGDRTVEGIEDFSVNMNADNASLIDYSAYGFIIDDDGQPGVLDHFSWSSVTSPAPLGRPIPITLDARDYFGTPVSDYSGPVILAALGFDPDNTSTLVPTNTSLTPTTGAATWGYAFTPNTDIIVTQVRHCFGSKVSIWTDDGSLLVSQAVSSTPGTWQETPLAQPVPLHAGVRYRVGVYNGSGNSYVGYNIPTTFNAGTIDGIYTSTDDSFPNTYTYYNYNIGLVDLRYSLTSPLPVAPAISGLFTNASWSGTVTVLGNAPGVVLRADGGQGRSDFSNPFTLASGDDISLALHAAPNPVGVGGALTYTLAVTNTGPSAATDVVITNYLPAGVTVQSVESSQGACVQNGAVITGSLGDLAGGATATLEITVTVPTTPTVLTNLAMVSRAEPDFTLSNNVVTSITSVQVPMASIDDANVVEGDVGFTEMDFKVRLAPPAGTTVTVHYATAPGTADPTDFVATNGLLTFRPGEAEKNIAVWVRNDLLNEADETLTVSLSNLTGALLGRNQATGTITNDDPFPNLYVLDTAVVEGNSGMTNALMTVQLSAPSGRTITVGFSTSDGTATSRSDYIPTNGLLVFAPGVTAQSFTVSVLGDTQVENTELFYVDLQSYTNVLGYYYSATAFILNDDGLSGNVDHFAWGDIASPQSFGQPLTVTLAAQDFYAETVTNFSGPVALSAFAVTGESIATLLNTTAETSTYYSGYYTLAYAFTPDTDLQVTHFRYCAGIANMKISLWTDDGTLLVSQTVTNASANWLELPLAVPITLTAGSHYRLSLYAASAGIPIFDNLPPTFAHGTIDANYYIYGSGDLFPTYQTSGAWPLVDLRYAILTLQSIPLTPTNAATFTNGVWSGDLMLAQPGAKVLLRAEDEVGHVGWSTPFNLGTALGIRQEGTNIILSWPSYASGYVLESASDLTAPLNWVSNLSPASVVGGWYMVTNPVTPGANLFRLRWP